MPDLYSHMLFGECVLTSLPKSLDIDKQLFIWAQEGPDFWLFWKPWKRLGRNRIMHEEKALEFIDYLITKYRGNVQVFSYAIGFLCHMVYDEFAHPYINYRVSDELAPWYCGNHMSLERALDVRKMKKNHKSPRTLIRVWPSKKVKLIADSLSEAYQQIYGWHRAFPEICAAYRVRFIFYCLFWDPLWLLYGIGKIMKNKKIESYSFQGKTFPTIDIENNKHNYWGKVNMSFDEVTSIAVTAAVEKIIYYSQI